MIWMFLQIIHDVPILHPWWNKTKSIFEELSTYPIEGKYIRMVQLSPNQCLMTEWLNGMWAMISYCMYIHFTFSIFSLLWFVWKSRKTLRQTVSLLNLPFQISCSFHNRHMRFPNKLIVAKVYRKTTTPYGINVALPHNVAQKKRRW